MVIVDTSIFIDFFRGKNNVFFESLLLEDKVVLSPIVRLELLQGVRKTEWATLNYVLQGLLELEVNPHIFKIGEQILASIKGSGLTVAISDLLLAGESILANLPIYSSDKIFAQLAKLKIIKTI